VMHMAFWLLCDFLLSSKVAGKPAFFFPAIWLLREVAHLPLWIHIALGNSIIWRGKTIHLKKNRFPKRHYAIEDLHEFLRSPKFATRHQRNKRAA